MDRGGGTVKGSGEADDNFEDESDHDYQAKILISWLVPVYQGEHVESECHSSG